MATLNVYYDGFDEAENGRMPTQFDVIATGQSGTVVSNVAGRVTLRADAPIVWPLEQQGRRGDDEFTFYLDVPDALADGQQVTFDVHASGQFAIASNIQT